MLLRGLSRQVVVRRALYCTSTYAGIGSPPHRHPFANLAPARGKSHHIRDRFLRRGGAQARAPQRDSEAAATEAATIAAAVEAATDGISSSSGTPLGAAAPGAATSTSSNGDAAAPTATAKGAHAAESSAAHQASQEGSESPSKPSTTAQGVTASSTPHENGLRRLFASWQQGVVASIGAVMGIGFIIYLLYTPVKEDTVHHTAVVASEALGDIRLRNQALQLSKEIVVNVLRDERSLQLVVDLVRKLLAQEDTKTAISSLLQSLFEDHYTQEVTKKFVLMIVRDPWIMDQLQVIAKEQVLRLLADEKVKQALSQFLTQSASKSLSEPALQYETARAVRKSVMSAINPWS